MKNSKEHWRAKALLNAGDRLRSLKKANVPANVLRQNQREVWRLGAKFLADLIGPNAYLEMQEDEHPINYASNFFHALRPIFPSPPHPDGIFWNEIFSEIDRMPYGDEPDILRPNVRSPGQPTQPAKLAFFRMRALEWAKFWKNVGAQPKHYQRAIALAFGSDWDAIRHWPDSIRKVIGQDNFDRWIANAADGYFIDHRDWHVTVMDPLKIDGFWYRSAIGLPEMSDKVVHGEWENLTRSLSVHASIRLP